MHIIQTTVRGTSIPSHLSCKSSGTLTLLRLKKGLVTCMLRLELLPGRMKTPNFVGREVEFLNGSLLN